MSPLHRRELIVSKMRPRTSAGVPKAWQLVELMAKDKSHFQAEKQQTVDSESRESMKTLLSA